MELLTSVTISRTELEIVPLNILEILKTWTVARQLGNFNVVGNIWAPNHNALIFK